MKSTGLRWVGDRALLVECDSLAAVLAIHARLADMPLAGRREQVPAARTVLLCFDRPSQARAAYPSLIDIEALEHETTAGREITLDVVYDGNDLADVAAHTGLSVDDVIAAHTGQRWQAAFGGFVPGFFYMTGEDRRLAVPRRKTPRTRVPAGAVGLAGTFSAVYPKASPGGWQLIGRTDARLWDLSRDEPALLRAGDTIRYRAVEALAEDARGAPDGPDDDNPASEEPKDADSAETRAALTVTQTGLQTLFQDLGRPGRAHEGVPASGAADEAAARQANRLVGNRSGTAVLETLLDGLALCACGAVVVAVAGAPGLLTVTGPYGQRVCPSHRPVLLRDQETLTFGTLEAGLRRYLAVRGGFVLPPVLASRATDTLSGIGPAALTRDQCLPVARAAPSQIVGAPEPGTFQTGDDTDAVRLRVVLGPRADWFDAASCQRFLDTVWQVTDQSNRIGVRLAAPANDDTEAPLPALHRVTSAELPSEGCVPGALQVPPSGLPVLFLKDHPVTGGYPVIAVVVAADLDRATQLAPGDAVQFVVDSAADRAETQAKIRARAKHS